MDRLPTAIVLGIASVALADAAVTTVPLPGGTSVVGACTLSSVYGQSTSLDSLTASNVALSPSHLCIEASDLGELGDLNGDGSVNGVDLISRGAAWAEVSPSSATGAMLTESLPRLTRQR
jgi:hypothetical protein